MLSKTALKKMKKADLVEHILEMQEKNSVDALFDRLSLTAAEQAEELKNEKRKVEEQKKISFWRMCESYNGFRNSTNLFDSEWLEEMKAMIDDRQEDLWCEGSADELFSGYKDWIGYDEWKKENADDDDDDDDDDEPDDDWEDDEEDWDDDEEDDEE